jgi:BirA family transcriptional regulator, biotin operon repressor / biotin---[acetyl-CoA-carboxylase] ligase
MNAYTLAALRLLQDGAFHSGEAIGQRIGVSRESISTALEGIEVHGLDIERVRGRGYRLRTPVCWLHDYLIQRHLGARRSRFTIEVVDETVSTNDDLIARAAQGAPSGLVRVAELQTGGRGRRGRGWSSGLGGALTFSVLWRFDQGAGFLSGLSLAVGVALLRALDNVDLKGAQLKWPNDVLWRHMKLAGILIELAGDVMGPTSAVIGIGLNVRLAQPVLDRIDQPVTDLARAGVNCDRNQLLATILYELDGVMETFSADGFAPLREEWQRAHAYQDKMVRLRMPDGTELEGTSAGVADDGALLLATPEGIRKYYGGEISLRLSRN